MSVQVASILEGGCRGHQITPHDQRSSLKSRHQFLLRAMNIAAIDIGKPSANFGWAMVGDTTAEGTDIDLCVRTLAAALRNGPLALGFEAPMFVPIQADPKRLRLLAVASLARDCPADAPRRGRSSNDCSFSNAACATPRTSKVQSTSRAASVYSGQSCFETSWDTDPALLSRPCLVVRA